MERIKEIEDYGTRGKEGKIYRFKLEWRKGWRAQGLCKDCFFKEDECETVKEVFKTELTPFLILIVTSNLQS